LSLTNLTTGEVIPVQYYTHLAYDAPSNTVTITFPGYANSVLPSGNYHAVVLAPSAVDKFGNPMAQDYAFDFVAGNVTGNNDTFRITRESSGMYDVFVKTRATPDFTYLAT